MRNGFLPDEARRAEAWRARGPAAVGKAAGEAVECSAKRVKRDPSSQSVGR
jgi:hypothetical protein